MLRLLEYAGDNDALWNKGTTEHAWTVETMQRYNQEHDNDHTRFFLATPEQTQAFGGVLDLADKDGLLHIPYVAAGTFANLAWDERESLLKHCPELKTIFPSLHEPTCFGAHPKPDTCRASICALQEHVPSSGC